MTGFIVTVVKIILATVSNNIVVNYTGEGNVKSSYSI